MTVRIGSGLEIVALGDDEILLKSEKIEFKVVPGAKTKNKGNIVFDLNVSSKDELLELSQKAQFLHYRYGENSTCAEHKNDGQLEVLELIDPDGRRWRFQTFH